MKQYITNLYSFCIVAGLFLFFTSCESNDCYTCEDTIGTMGSETICESQYASNAEFQLALDALENLDFVCTKD